MPKDDAVVEVESSQPADDAIFEVEKYITFLTGIVWLRRMAFLDRMQERRREKLIRWRRIVYGTAALRIGCCVALMTTLLVFRYSDLDHLTEHNSAKEEVTITQFLIFNGIAVMITLCILVILAEFVLIIVATSQMPNQIAFTYAISSVLVFLLIAVGCFSGGAVVHVDTVTAVIFGAKAPDNIHGQQSAVQCCGAHGPSDWFHLNFFRWEDPALAETRNISNDLGWMKSCFTQDIVTCTLPPSCCPNRKSCLDQVSKLDYNEMQIAAAQKNSKRMEELESKFPISSSGAYQTGCFPKLREATKKILLAISILVFLLCLLSVLMTVLIVAGLLYRSAVGAIDTKNLIITPTTRDPLVRFFMRLDGTDFKDDMTLTDFSIIEGLKRFDIDDRFGENEAK